MAMTRGTGTIVCFMGLLGLALYPTVISPMFDPKPYKEIQKITRKDINQRDIQPGNMNVWSDPFDRKKPE